ncbi:MAG: trypsin-like peptidase domain-containing protein, partial [Actinomycetota bacterium]|nr:trypsin-like peptidase domain-containing protein [Actinomycetota bacterium]
PEAMPPVAWDATAAPAAAPTRNDYLSPSPRAQRARRGLSAWWLVPLVVVSLAAGGAGGVLAQRYLGADRPVSANLPVSPAAPVDRAPESVAGIAASVLPSVVAIEVSSDEGRGSGSGFILRADGYILTNNHVVAGGAGAGGSITVVFADGTQEAATVVGATLDYDLAVIKVARTGLTSLALGDSDAVVVGDQVVAVGAPLGLQGTVTSGIVSAVNRPVTAGDAEGQAFINAIQTDAAINPGNSGGPLVNLAGEVVGVNSAIAQLPGAVLSGTGSIGLGFAIPSNQVRRTAEQLIETGEATYPYIGVILDERYRGEGVQVLAAPEGESTTPVEPDSPADRAGIRPGDIIVAIDGRPVTEPDEVVVAIRARAPGDTVTLRVRTGDDERDVRVVLAERSSD